MGAAEKQYKEELKQARLEDRDKCDLFINTMQRQLGLYGYYPATYNSATGAVSAQVGV
jgi:hypothetical protein